MKWPIATTAGLLALVMAAGLGWLNPGEPEQVVSAVRRGGDRPAAFPEKPGSDTYAAVSGLRDLLEDPQPPPPPPEPSPPPPPPPPPPPDISEVFRAALRGLVRPADGGPLLVLVRGPGGETPRRLGAGDMFHEGWRVRLVEPTRVVLERGRESRSVRLYETG